MLANLYWLSFWLLQEAVVSWDLPSMWARMGNGARAVIVVLVIMSALSIGVMIDRAVSYTAARKQSRYFVQAVAGALREGKLEEAVRIAERNKKSHIAKVVATGLSEFQAHSSLPEDDIIEASKRGLDRSVAIEHANLKRGLSGLATIGATAAPRHPGPSHPGASGHRRGAAVAL